MNAPDKLTQLLEQLTTKYMTEKGWNRRRARRKAEAQVRRHLHQAMLHAPPGRRPVMATLGKLRLQEIGRAIATWCLTRGVYVLAGLAVGLLAGVVLYSYM